MLFSRDLCCSIGVNTTPFKDISYLLIHESANIPPLYIQRDGVQSVLIVVSDSRGPTNTGSVWRFHNLSAIRT